MSKRLTTEVKIGETTPLTYEKLKDTRDIKITYPSGRGIISGTTEENILTGTPNRCFSFDPIEDTQDNELFYGTDGSDQYLFIRKEEAAYSYSHADSIFSTLETELNRISETINDISLDSNIKHEQMNSDGTSLYQFNNGDSNPLLPEKTEEGNT